MRKSLDDSQATVEQRSKSHYYIGWNFLLGILTVGLVHGIYYLASIFARIITGKWLEGNPIAWVVNRVQNARERKYAMIVDDELSESLLEGREKESERYIEPGGSLSQDVDLSKEKPGLSRKLSQTDQLHSEKEDSVNGSQEEKPIETQKTVSAEQKRKEEKSAYAKPFAEVKKDFRHIDHDIYLGVKKYKENGQAGSLRIDIIPDMYFADDSFMRKIIQSWGTYFNDFVHSFHYNLEKGFYEGNHPFYAFLMMRGDIIKERLLERYPSLQPKNIKVVHSVKSDPRHLHSPIPEELKKDIGEDAVCQWFAHFYVEIDGDAIPAKLLQVTSPFDTRPEWLTFQENLIQWNSLGVSGEHYFLDLLKEAVEEYQKKGSKGEMTIKIVPDRDISRIDFLSFFYLCRLLNLEKHVWEGEDLAKNVFVHFGFALQVFIKGLGVDQPTYVRSQDDTRFSKKDFPPGGGRDNPRGGNAFCPKVYSFKLPEDAAYKLIDALRDREYSAELK